MKKKILILNDRFDLKNSLINLGDRALSDGLYRLLGKNLDYEIVSAGWKNFPYVNFDCFKQCTDEKEIEKVFEMYYQKICTYSRFRLFIEYNVLRSVRFLAKLFWPLIKPIDDAIRSKMSIGIDDILIPRLFRAFTANQFLKKLGASDLVMNNMAGLVTDVLVYYVPMWLFETYCAIRERKPTIIVNQTVDTTDEGLKMVIHYIYSRCHFHLTREIYSKEWLERLGIDKDKVATAFDSAFFEIYSDESEVLTRYSCAEFTGHIGLVLRGDRYVDYDAWSEVIATISKKYEKKVYIIHTCWAHDLHVFKELSKKCEIYELPRTFNYKDIPAIMKQFEVVISDRYHAAIFSIIGSTPVVPMIPESGKLAGLFMMLDYPVKALHLLNKSNIDTFYRGFDEVYQKRKSLRSFFQDKYPKIHDSVYCDYMKVLSSVGISEEEM